MKKILTILVALCAIACTSGKTTIYDFTAESNSGEQVNFKDYKGKVLLVVNTASKCGFTPQYDGLEASPATSSATRSPAATRRSRSSAA